MMSGRLGMARCDMTVNRRGHVGQCSREATEHYTTAENTCVGHYCRQHADGAGAARMLLPRAWEYDHVESYHYRVAEGLGRKA